MPSITNTPVMHGYLGVVRAECTSCRPVGSLGCRCGLMCERVPPPMVLAAIHKGPEDTCSWLDFAATSYQDCPSDSCSMAGRTPAAPSQNIALPVPQPHCPNLGTPVRVALPMPASLSSLLVGQHPAGARAQRGRAEVALGATRGTAIPMMDGQVSRLWGMGSCQSTDRTRE